MGLHYEACLPSRIVLHNEDVLMDGVHDFGGTNGFGAIVKEVDEPVFHEPWEHIGYAMGFLGLGMNLFTIDEVRHAIERIEPRHYMAATYYERFFTGVASLFVEKGILTQQELEEAAGGAFPLSLPPKEGILAREASVQFELGETVQVCNMHIKGHSRMPKYVRGKRGVVTHIAPVFPYASAAGHGMDAKEEPTYHVKFNAKDLWSDASENATVVVDLWESYLEKT
jgi:nitrile hydratase beta subunit